MNKYNQPCMSEQCVEFLKHLFKKYNIKDVFEFGSGGSTYLFSGLIGKDGHITSIEHDEFFYNRLRDNPKIFPNTNVIISLKSVKSYPIVDKAYNEFWDFIFIDGIKRIKCMKNAVGKTTLIAIHDSEREEYIHGFNYIESYGYQDISPEGINIKVFHNANPNNQL